MRFQIFILLTLLFLAGPGSTALCQGGGKAEPKRIEFERGTSGATIKNVIRRSEEAEYVFAARQGQKVKITLASSPPGSALFQLRNGDGVASQLEFDGTNWSGPAPGTGDYLITVVGRGSQRVVYTLRLAIK